MENLQQIDIKNQEQVICYIRDLEKRVEALENKMNLIEDHSDLLQSDEERYYKQVIK